MSDLARPLYFKGLNGIRAIAAWIVIIFHIDQFSRLFAVDKVGFHETGMAGYAVDMFFVLSGFLITYLLLIEKEKTGSIQLKLFYLRRICRIWPLYYLAVLISGILIYFDIVPEAENPFLSFSLYIFFAANLAYALNAVISSIVPLWSVGVEEQFYLFWPYFIRKISNYIAAFSWFFIAFIALKLAIYLLFSPESAAYLFIMHTSLDIMCMGAMGAYLVYSDHPLLKLLYRKEAQLAAWAMLLCSLLYKPLHVFSFFDHELNSFFYLILILNVSSNRNSLVSLENRVFNFLGRISYGLYVYHLLVIYIVSSFFAQQGIEVSALSMYASVVITTILVSSLSYYYFELPILKIKRRYSVVESTDEDPGLAGTHGMNRQ